MNKKSTQKGKQFSLLRFFLLLFLINISFASLQAKSIFYLSSNNTFTSNQSQTIPLQEAIDNLAKIYDVSIIYDVEQLEKAKIKDWKTSKKSIEVDLKDLLKNFDLSYQKLNDRTFVIKKNKKNNSLKKKNSSTSVAPPKPVLKMLDAKGFILDNETREPLIGVNIFVENSGEGTVTELDGSFTIRAEEGSLLTISYLGYLTQEIKIKKANLGTILLSTNSSQLDEVVVVGYGTQRRSDLTGALSSVSEKELKALPSTGLDQALQGRAAGVYVTQNSGAPGGGVSIRIRGIGSTLTAEPLYVIDGIPVVNDNQASSSNFSELDGGGQNSNALNTINPSDIESIEILKDASATAIYGARAANGVVLITTKRGAKGTSNLAFETYYGVQELSKKIPVLNLREYAEYYNDVGWEGIEEFQNPELLGEGTDWQDAVFRQAQMQNYQLTASGGTEKTRYALSGSYHSKEGIVVGSDFNRISGKINLDHSISDRVRIGNSFLLSRTKENITFNDNSSGVVYTALLMVPNAPVRNSDGSFAGPQEEITLSFDNPVARALETNDVNRKTRVLSNIYLEADLFSFLKYRTEFGTDLIYSDHSTFFPSFERGNFFGKSGIRKNNSSSRFWINKHLLTFNKKFADKHNLTVLAGFEAQTGGYDWLYASRDNLPTNDLQQINLGDIGQQQTGGGAGHWALLSYFGRFNYGFDDKYLLTGTLRVDGSSRFSPNNRYGVFPSAAFAWRLSNEEFIKNIEAIDNFKLRVGVGEVGNQEIGLYSYLANLRNTNVVFGDQLVTGFVPDNISNPDVRWESSFQTNVGIDLGLFNNRLELIMDYYVKKADGMLLPALIPLTSGSLNAPFVNIGEIENRGLEVSLNTVNTTGQLKWNSGINFSINRNEVINLGDNGNLVGIIQRIPVTRTEEGKSISQFYGYVMEGIFQDQAEVTESPFQSDGTRAGDIKFADLNDDGIINDEDQTFIGNPLPDFTLNFSNEFNFKGFDLNIFIQGVYGNEILNLMRRDIEGLAGLNNQSSVVKDRFTNLDGGTTVPRPTGSDPNANRRVSSRFIEDGSFIRIKNITLGYNFPKTWLGRAGFSNLRLYASTQNLYTFTNYSGYDPEVGSYNQNPLINGVENGRYPISRSYTFGINANF
ncbi:MAG: SusC/RagA family TonB-linked outer membrane protein [Saprospiraceae bacterium]